MRRRIRFTRTELEVINSMAAIAGASKWGEGDYQSWGDQYGNAFDNLREKVWELISRADGLPNHLGPESDQEILSCR